jgi:DNA (cytosine-5)-methyltransferase 1
MVASLNDLGYTVEWRILNAAEYGFPQRRRRIFIIGYIANTPIDKQRKKSNQKDWITSLGVLGKSFPCVEKNSNTEFELIGDLEKISNTTFSKNGKSSFYNSGISINRKVYSIDVKKETVKWKMTLGGIIEKNIKKIPEEFWVDEKDHQKWKDVKGAKQKERTSKSGHKYMFSEGKMDTLDSYDKPSRTIITSEGGKTPSRVKHLIEHNKKWRRLIPSELEQLNMFPKDFTNYKDISNNKRSFLMGNALVVGLVEKIGETIGLFDSK